jgi:Sec-independent protein translocase protein TatA
MRCYNLAMLAVSYFADIFIIVVVFVLLFGRRLPELFRSFRDGPP